MSFTQLLAKHQMAHFLVAATYSKCVCVCVQDHHTLDDVLILFCMLLYHLGA